MTKKQFEAITKWQNENFPDYIPLIYIQHLLSETIELTADLACKSPERKLEFADCFILLFGAAAADGMSYEDICKVISEKFEINKKRSWGSPDSNGIVKHIKTKQK